MKRTNTRRGLLECPFRREHLRLAIRRCNNIRPNPPCPHCGGRSIKIGLKGRGVQYFHCKSCLRRHSPYARLCSLPRKITTPGQCPYCDGRLRKDGVRNGKQKYECTRCHRRCTGDAVAPRPVAPPPTRREVRQRQRQARMAGDDLLTMVRAATNLPPAVREDVEQELCLAALMGEFDLSNIAAAVQTYRKRINRLSSTTGKFVSIDGIVPGKRNLTYAETIIG